MLAQNPLEYGMEKRCNLIQDKIYSKKSLKWYGDMDLVL